ncbi:MAG: hypothetical protein ACW96X_13190 [Promethearchaeota archaeon]|jgi:hypothetical protein
MANGTSHNGVKKFFSPTVVIQIFAWLGLFIFFVSSANSHIKDENVHMPFERKVESFVTRSEFDLFKADVMNRLDNIHEDIQSLNEFLRNRNNKK